MKRIQKNQYIKICNKFLKSLDVFKYLVKSLANQKYNREEIISRLHSGNPCRHSVQNILSCIKDNAVG